MSLDITDSPKDSEDIPLPGQEVSLAPLLDAFIAQIPGLVLLHA